MARLVSPYAVGGAGNPMRDILSAVIDFDRLAAGPVKLFITATNVRTGRGRVFRNHEITAGRAARLGLPADDVPGGRDRRRALLGRRLQRQPDADAAGPRVRRRRTPSWCRSTRSSGRRPPRTARDIASRMNEVSFNAVLLKELRMIAVLRQVVDAGSGEGARWARHADAPHQQRDDDTSSANSSKLNAEWAFLTMLRDEGRRRRRGLRPRATRADIGVRSTFDLDACSTASDGAGDAARSPPCRAPSWRVGTRALLRGPAAHRRAGGGAGGRGASSSASCSTPLAAALRRLPGIGPRVPRALALVGAAVIAFASGLWVVRDSVARRWRDGAAGRGLRDGARAAARPRRRRSLRPDRAGALRAAGRRRSASRRCCGSVVGGHGVDDQPLRHRRDLRRRSCWSTSSSSTASSARCCPIRCGASETRRLVDAGDRGHRTPTC